MLIPVICTVSDKLFLESGKTYYLETDTLDYYLSANIFVADIYDYDDSNKFVCKSELSNFIKLYK